jgi:hypothetical protein
MRAGHLIVAEWLLTLAALRAVDDLEQRWPSGGVLRKDFAFKA